MLRVGLTGGIACGKSHVLRRLAARGLATLDLDAVAHALMAPGGAAYEDVVAAFGRGILAPGGAIDRKALGARVFGDAAARVRLDALVHPRVRAEEARWAAAFAGRPGVLVTDAALLVEAGAHLRFDRLVVVHCDPEEQMRRLRARDGLDERVARTRVEAQMPLAEKRAFAHLEVDTSGSVDDTDRAADALAQELTRLAIGGPGSAGVGVDGLVGGLVHGPRTGPRGLSPLALLEAAAEAGGLEMDALARRLTPPATRAWYRTAQEADPGAPATHLAVALAAWALRRGAPDPPFLAAAAGSIARLTHTDPPGRADACLLALVAQDVATAGRVPGDLEAWADRRMSLARQFGGGPPSGRLDLAEGLEGLGLPVEPSPRAVALRAALEAVPAAPR